MNWDEQFDTDTLDRAALADAARAGRDMDEVRLLEVMRRHGDKAEGLLDIVMNEVREGLSGNRMEQRGLYALLRSLRARVTTVRNACRQLTAERHASKADRGQNFSPVTSEYEIQSVLEQKATFDGEYTMPIDGCLLMDIINSRGAHYEEEIAEMKNPKKLAVQVIIKTKELQQG